MINVTIARIVKNIEETDIAPPVKRALVSYAKKEMQKSLLVNIMDATPLPGNDRVGVNRWIERIDEASVAGFAPGAKQRISLGGRMPRRKLRMQSVDIPQTRSRSRSTVPSETEGLVASEPEQEQEGETEVQDAKAVDGGSGVGNTLEDDKGYEVNPSVLEDEGRGRKSKCQRRRGPKVVGKKVKTSRKTSEREKRRAKKNEKRAKLIEKLRKKMVGSSASEDSSESSSGESSDSTSSSDTSFTSSLCDSSEDDKKKGKKKRPIKFKVNKYKEEWNDWSAKKKAGVTMKWRAYVGKPVVWYAHYGGKLRLDESLSVAHAWKLTLCWATDLAIFGCNRDIMFTGKTAEKLEDALLQTARKRNDYYSWKSALDVQLDTWLVLLPWLKVELLKYKKQLADVWLELKTMFSPAIYKALARIQDLHRFIMLGLDMDPFKLPGDKELLKNAKKKFCIHEKPNVPPDFFFHPVKWLDPESQALILPPGARGGGSGNKQASSGYGPGPGTFRPEIKQAGAEYCMDYNLSVNGCTRAFCRFVHACSCLKGEPHVCGGAGPYRLCPRGHIMQAQNGQGQHRQNPAPNPAQGQNGGQQVRRDVRGNQAIAAVAGGNAGAANTAANNAGR